MLSNLLLRLSTILLMCGLTLGIVMGIRQDFTLAPAHAHLNLVGFVIMFIAGLYYRIAPEAAEGLLAKVQAALLVVGALVFPVGIAMVLSWGHGYEAAAIIGAFIVYAAVGLFAVIVFRSTTAPRRALQPAGQSV